MTVYTGNAVCGGLSIASFGNGDKRSSDGNIIQGSVFQTVFGWTNIANVLRGAEPDGNKFIIPDDVFQRYNGWPDKRGRLCEPRRV